MDKINIRQVLIAAGVKNLKEFGYPDVNHDNILTDEVYKSFFLSMINDNIQEIKPTGRRLDVLAELKKLKSEIDNH